MHKNQSGVGILLVDDDEDVRAFVALSLRVSGYRIYQAGSGEEALRVFADHGNEIELLLSDVVMPGMSGDKLAVQLLARKPSLKLVLMSGNPMSTIKSAIPLEEGSNFLQKPFSVIDLRECLAQLLSPAPHA